MRLTHASRTGLQGLAPGVSGERASIKFVPALKVGNNVPKGTLMPDGPERVCRKESQEGHVLYQLVGKVKAHQGYDG